MPFPDYLAAPYIVSGNLALYLEWPDNEPVIEDGEKWQVLIFDSKGKILFLSPIVSPLVARGWRHKFYTYVRGSAFVTILHHSTRRGVTGTGRASFQLPIKNLRLFANGISEVTINLSNLVESPSGQKARRVSSSRVKPTGAKAYIGPKSTPRPNESTSIQFRNHVDRRDNWTLPWYVPVPDTFVPLVTHTRNWTGVRTPGFWKLKRSQLPVNPHTVFVRDTVVNPNITITTNTDGFVNVSITTYTNVYPAALTAVHNGQAINKALSKLVGKAGVDMKNVAQDLAQLGQTIDLLSGTLNRLTGSISALKQGNLVRAADSLFGSARRRYRKKGGPSAAKSLADNWLELQYGWKPLIQNIHDSLQALKTLQSPIPVILRVTASATVKTQETKSFLSTQGIPRSPAGKTSVFSATTVKFALRYKVDDKLTSFLAQLGFTNPVNLAWEILPFSFVVDWFYPIGPFLETLSSWDGLTFLDGSQTQLTRQITDSAISFKRQTGTETSGTRTFERSSYHDRQVLLDRVKLTAFPSTAAPQLKNGLKSLTRATNGLALLKSVFGK